MLRVPQAARLCFPLLFLAALAGCGLSGPAYNAPATTGAAAVDMGFSSFDPPIIHIKAGQTVEWRNTSLITHTVADDAKLADDASHASIPAGATSFNSGDIPAGQVFRYTFTVPGTYKYFCTHHEDDDMVGTIVVDPAS
jgi:plastocyanin